MSEFPLKYILKVENSEDTIQKINSITEALKELEVQAIRTSDALSKCQQH